MLITADSTEALKGNVKKKYNELCFQVKYSHFFLPYIIIFFSVIYKVGEISIECENFVLSKYTSNETIHMKCSPEININSRNQEI